MAYFDTVDDMMNAVNSIILNHVHPAAMDFMDNSSIRTVEAFLNCGLKVGKEFLLLLELDGFNSSMSNQLELVSKLLTKANATDVEIANNIEESDKIWFARNSSFSAATRLAPDVLSDDIIVPRDKLAEIIKTCRKIAVKYSLKVCMVGHVGDANIHPQFVLDLNDEQEFRNYQLAKSEIYEQVKNLGGILSAEHGVGLEKKSNLELFLGEQNIDYMKEMKKYWDPKNILNPDKIF